MFSQVSFNVFFGLIARGLLAYAAGWLASHKILDQGATAQWVEVGTLMIVTYGWSWVEKYFAKQDQNTLIATALQMQPTATVADVHAEVADGFGVTPKEGSL
jgi:predicted membrane-bound spermidine synthase